MLQLPVHITCSIISTHSATVSGYNVTYSECICIMLKKDQTLVTQLCGTEQSYILCRNILCRGTLMLSRLVIEISLASQIINSM